MSRIPVEPWLVMTSRTVRDELLTDPREFASKLSEYERALKEVTKYHWDNSHFRMWTPMHRSLTTFLVSIGDGTIEFNVWDQYSQSIGKCSAQRGEDYNEHWKDRVHALFARISDFDKGIRYCCDCDCQMTEIAGRYFGGIYCADCWEGKWKAIEARETYN